MFGSTLEKFYLTGMRDRRSKKTSFLVQNTRLRNTYKRNAVTHVKRFRWWMSHTSDVNASTRWKEIFMLRGTPSTPANFQVDRGESFFTDLKGLFEFRQRCEEESGGRITPGFPGNLYTHTEWIAAINSRREFGENVPWTRIIYDLPGSPRFCSTSFEYPLCHR